jgi:xylan 1,4-beta-xylosidase
MYISGFFRTQIMSEHQIHNPVICGFSPDPSFVRVGDDYYIANSTFEWFPGVAIHHSRDLIHWRFIGHALTRSSQINLKGVADSGGVWAPSMSYHDGQFWLIYTNIRTWGMGRPFKDIGVYLTTATHVLGPWSDPIYLHGIGFDPSLFHDDDGRKWLVNMKWDFRKDKHRFGGIVLQEYDHAARKLVGPMHTILEKSGVLIEGPNLYKRNGYYYLMLAEGGTGWNHGISMARSRSITGSYELDPQHSVLTTRDDPLHPLQKCGHGEIVDTPSGEWYLAHLASRPLKTTVPANLGSPDKTDAAAMRLGYRCVLGRETCIQKVKWSADNWLRLDWDGHTPKVDVPAPQNTEQTPWPDAPARDHFDDKQLDVSWSALRGPIEESWLSLTARPGWLRLRGRECQQSLFDQSLVAKRLTSPRATVQTCMEFEPSHYTQMAGLICYYDTRTHYYLRVTHDENVGKVLGVVLTDDTKYDELLDSQISIDDWKQIYLRAEIDGERLQFSASKDGTNWRPVGPVLDASKLSDDYGTYLHFTGTFVGVCAQDLGSASAIAEFAYFEIH